MNAVCVMRRRKKATERRPRRWPCRPDRRHADGPTRTMTDVAPSPFDDSRRLTGPNLYFAETGAALETLVGTPVPEALLASWQTRLAQARTALGWPHGDTVIRRHDSGASLAFSAPFDQLYAAADVNEWAWLASLYEHGRLEPDAVPFAPGHPAVWNAGQAMRSLAAAAGAEKRPALHELADAARARKL